MVGLELNPSVSRSWFTGVVCLSACLFVCLLVLLCLSVSLYPSLAFYLFVCIYFLSFLSFFPCSLFSLLPSTFFSPVFPYYQAFLPHIVFFICIFYITQHFFFSSTETLLPSLSLSINYTLFFPSPKEVHRHKLYFILQFSSFLYTPFTL